MKRIYKYAYDSAMQGGPWQIEATKGATPVAFQWQNSAPTVWVELDPGKVPASMHFWLAATGQPIPDRGAYVGTIQYPTSGLVFHLYQIK